MTASRWLQLDVALRPFGLGSSLLRGTRVRVQLTKLATDAVDLRRGRRIRATSATMPSREDRAPALRKSSAGSWEAVVEQREAHGRVPPRHRQKKSLGLRGASDPLRCRAWERRRRLLPYLALRPCRMLCGEAAVGREGHWALARQRAAQRRLYLE